jgi:hypothetical protein
MNAGTYRSVAGTCAIVIATLAVASLVWAAGAKLSSIETRLTSIEGTLEEIKDGGSLAGAAQLGDGLAGGAGVGHTEPIVRLLPLSPGDEADGMLVLCGDAQDPE